MAGLYFLKKQAFLYFYLFYFYGTPLHFNIHTWSLFLDFDLSLYSLGKANFVNDILISYYTFKLLYIYKDSTFSQECCDT